LPFGARPTTDRRIDHAPLAMRSNPGFVAPRIKAMRIRAGLWVALLLAVSLGGDAAQAADTAARPGLTGTPLLTALRSGGYVLYFRHAATDIGQKAADYENCANEINLTEAGRADARAIGAAIRSLGVPIGEVLASPFCRTRETAELIFGRAIVTPGVLGGSASDEGGRYAELKLLFARRVASGANLVIVSHRDQFIAVAGGPFLEEGEAAVIEPLDSGGFRVVIRIRKDEWAALK
jgi:Histidine phosphatase superfamily (branch 1)